MNADYEFEEQCIRGVYKIMPFSSSDPRGFSVKDYSAEVFEKKGIIFQPQEILTIKSKKGVLRGIHFQRVKGQAKLIQCVSGGLWCAVVDLRKDYATFGQWISVDIDEGMELYVPGDCALGTLAIEDSIMLCACDAKRIAEYDDGIRWDDFDIGVEWPLSKIGGTPVLSDRDKMLGSFNRFKNSID